MLCNNGFDDVKLKIGGNEMKCVRSILCSQNALFSKLLNDSMCENGELTLNSKCSMESIELLIRYYGFGEIEITTENVIGLLKTCVFYDDMKLVEYCIKYILNHFDLELFIKILNSKELLNAECCEKVKEFIDEKLNEISKTLLNEKTISKLNYKSLIYILNQENIIYESESILFNNLCIWLKNEKEDKEEEDDDDDEIEYEEKKSELLKHINWKEINLKEIEKDNIEYIPKMDLSELIESSKSINHLYLSDIYKRRNFYEPKCLEEVLNTVSETNNVEELMKMFDEEIFLKFLKKLLSIFPSLSKQNKRNVSKLCASCYRSDIDGIEIIKENKEIFLLMLLYYNLMDKNMERLDNYELINLLKDPNDYKYYDEDDYDILEKIIDYKNLDIHRSKVSTYQCHVGENIIINAPVHGFGSCFKCELPEGLSIDYYSGKITGKPKQVGEGKYTIYYRSPSKSSINIIIKVLDKVEPWVPPQLQSQPVGPIHFGNSSDNPFATNSSSSLFGNSSPSPTSSLFGLKLTTTSGIFGNISQTSSKKEEEPSSVPNEEEPSIILEEKEEEDDDDEEEEVEEVEVEELSPPSSSSPSSEEDSD